MFPSNIETKMMTHPAVKDVAAVGLPDDIDGELPMAFVVVNTGDNFPTPTAKELIDFVKGNSLLELPENVLNKFSLLNIKITTERVADDEQLRGGVRFIEQIPRNKNGKIMRQQLVELL